MVSLSAVIFFAKKDIKKNRKTFILIILAISIVTANIIVLNGFIDGITDDFLERSMETSSGHVNIYPEIKDRYIDGYDVKALKLEQIGIASYSPRLSAVGSISYKDKSKPIQILSLDPEKENRVTKILSKLDSGETLGSNDSSSILISYRLADELNIRPGDDVTLAFEKGETKVYKTRGIVRTGLELDKNTVIMTFEEAQERLGLNNKASLILVRLPDKNMAEGYREILSRELAVTRIKVWREEIESAVSSMRVYRDITDSINIIGLFAAAVSVGVILYLNVLNKRREIGIMKAVGMKGYQVFAVYIIQAVVLGAIGLLLGSILGYIGTAYLEAHPFYDPVFGTMGPRFYMYLIYDAAAIISLTMVLAASYPAFTASRMNIIKAIWGG